MTQTKPSGFDPARAPQIVVIGGGGHARVLVDALRACSSLTIAVLDARPEACGSSVLDAEVIGSDDLLPALFAAGTRSFAVGVGSTQDGRLRARLFERAVALGLEPHTVVHPKAIVSPWAKLEPGVQVFAGAIVNPQAIVRKNAIINSGAIVEHDCVIGEHAHVAPGACLSGCVHVGELAHIGTGATIRQLITIGESAVVGAGAVVVKDVPPKAVVTGVPAREVQT